MESKKLAPGLGRIVVPVPCMTPAALGGSVMRKVEADKNLTDRFWAQTCAPTNIMTMFLPSSMPGVNRVHVFFTPGYANGQMQLQGMRAAAESAGWILVVLDGWPEKDPSLTISAQEICDQLERHGVAPTIGRLRLSAHSRGGWNLAKSLPKLVAKDAESPMVDVKLLDRVVSFDSTPDVVNALKDLYGTVNDIPKGLLFGYSTTSRMRTPWIVPENRTMNMSGDTAFSRGAAAISYLRLLDDAQTLHPELFPNAITDDADVKVLLPLIRALPLGTISTHSGASADFRKFCRDNDTHIKSMVGMEFAPPGGQSKPGRFLEQNGLTYMPVMGPILDHHHFFVADFAHEVTDDELPVPFDASGN